MTDVSTIEVSTRLLDERHTTRQAAVATQKACTWCGSLVVLSCLLGLAVFAHFAPPPQASMTDVEIGAVFRDNTTGIRIAMMLMVFGAALLGPFVAVISAHMRRVEGPRPTLSYLQLILGACFIMEIIFPMMAVQTAAYRPERADVVQQALNDWGWLTFFGVASTAFVQCVIIGALILQDRRTTPVFPRWSGYFNIWVGLMFTPGTVVVFFKTGPLSWTGLFIFWLPFTAFFAWLIVMTVLLLRAIDHETAEELASDAVPGPDPRVGALAEQLARVTAELGDMRNRLTRVESQPIP